MDELIDQIVGKTGLARTTVEEALGIIIAFLRRQDSQGRVGAMIDRLPGAGAIADAHGRAAGGLFAVFNQLSSAGLGMGEMQTVVGAFVAYAKAKLGDAEVDAVIRGIPGAGQFM